IPATTAHLNGPRTIAVDSSNNLYIADFNNSRVRKVVPGSDGVINGAADEFMMTIAGTGEKSSEGDDFPAIGAKLNGPNSVAVDPSGNIYIGESLGQRVRKIDTAGIITIFAGGG